MKRTNSSFLVREGADKFWSRSQTGSDLNEQPSFPSLLMGPCERVPGKLAMVHREFRYSYEELFGEVAAIALQLKARTELRPRSRVALLLDNSELYNIWYLAVLAADLVAVPLNTKLTAREIEYMLADSEAELLLSEPKFALVLDDLARRPGWRAKFEMVARHRRAAGAKWQTLHEWRPTGEDAAVYYTSGTTGKPKGVVHTHRSLIAGAIQGPPSWEYADEDSVNLAITPLFHIANHTVFLPTLAIGGTLVIDTFKSDEIFALIEAQKVTHLFAVPSMLLMMLQLHKNYPNDLSSVRNVAFGAAPMPAHKLRDIQSMFPKAKLVHGMGQTESCGTLVTLPSKFALKKAGSVGVNIAGTDIRIVDESDVELPANEVGELVARGPNVMSRYLNRPEATADALKGGWLHTGDLGYRDDQGFVFLVDRKKDLIIRGGENIYSTEVEQVLLALPEIASAAVIGIPSEVFGEEVLACLVCKEGARQPSLGEVQAHCMAQLAKYKVPIALRYFDALPQTATGKIQKGELKRVVANG